MSVVSLLVMFLSVMWYNMEEEGGEEEEEKRRRREGEGERRTSLVCPTCQCEKPPLAL